MRHRKKSEERKIALSRAERLLTLAVEAERESRAERSVRYVALARRMATRYNVRLPPELRRRFCRKCGGVLLPGKTLRVRTNDGVVTRTCLRCGAVRRNPFRRERATRRRKTPSRSKAGGGPDDSAQG